MSYVPQAHINVLVGDVNDPFWGQVLEGIYQAAKLRGVNIVNVMENLPFEPTCEEETALLEELQAQKLELLIDWGTPTFVARGLLDSGTTLVHLTETDIRHPRSVSPLGLYDAAQIAGNYLAEVLRGRGNVLMVGGTSVSHRYETGQSRINGFLDALKKYPQVSINHLLTGWGSADAYQVTSHYLEQHTEDFDAIFGLSDTLALSARDAARDMGRLQAVTRVVGINGDPFALAAIASGKISATVETSPIDLGRDAVELACRFLQGQRMPEHFPYRMRLVTAQNVHQVSAEKLFSLAEMPQRLVRFTHQQQQERMLQLETSVQINRSVGAILDLQQLSLEIANRIRANYGYDKVQLYRWMSDERVLVPEVSDGSLTKKVPINITTHLEEVIRCDRLLFIANVHQNTRFAPETDLQDTHSRLVLPIHYSGGITHLLDLQSSHDIFHTRQELIGLQLLADQFGIAIRNAELYSKALRACEDALIARNQVEKADNLKTRLLANVSHELSAPLNIIIDSSQSALAELDSYKVDLPKDLRYRLEVIRDSGEHLIRLINDLLDLSRAEIDELDLFIEAVNPRKLIEEAFTSIINAPSTKKELNWRLKIPPHLPVIRADPLRLRQILLNLLSNANKFTSSGDITLGVEISPPHLHLWVTDTGEGIPTNIQEQIFEPFVTAETANQRHEGIGLGLTITRRLVALHGGSLSLESQPGQGSTFHVYLPLPNLAGETLHTALNTGAQPVALFFSHNHEDSTVLTDFCKSQGLKPYPVKRFDNLNDVIPRAQPQVIVWDTAHPSPGDWAIIQKLRAHPQLCRLPFLLLGDETESKTTGLTNIPLKPVNSSTLLKMLYSLQSQQEKSAILVVDDDPKALEMYGDLLANQLPDFDVISVENGTEALEYLGKEIPALVILDLIMPDIDGFKVLDFIRSQEKTVSVPVMIFSGRMLSYEDVRRINYDRVIFQAKNVLSPSETIERLKYALSEKGFLPQATSGLVKHAIAFIHQNFDHTFALQDIAYAVGISKSYFSQVFRDEMGLPLWEYLNRYRVQKAREYLRSTDLPVTEISMRVGFDDFSYFGRVFNKYCGCSPRAYRKKGQE